MPHCSGYGRAPKPHRAIRPGDEALIVNGPFARRTVRIDDIVGQKARMTMLMFGALKTIEIPMLEAA